jgi:hypothetical protein
MTKVVQILMLMLLSLASANAICGEESDKEICYLDTEGVVRSLESQFDSYMLSEEKSPIYKNITYDMLLSLKTYRKQIEDCVSVLSISEEEKKTRSLIRASYKMGSLIFKLDYILSRKKEEALDPVLKSLNQDFISDDYFDVLSLLKGAR